MPSQKLILFASLFIIGCGEKSDEERLDDLTDQCLSLCDSYNGLADKCDLPPKPGDCGCAVQAALTEEFGCIDEAEVIIGCEDQVGYDSLTCDDDLEAELSACAADMQAWTDCTSLGN